MIVDKSIKNFLGSNGINPLTLCGFHFVQARFVLSILFIAFHLPVNMEYKVQKE